VDGRTDLYALGCVLYELLVGEPPFTAETPVAIAFKQVSEEAAPVGLRRPDVPPALDHAVARLLAKRPDERPASAAAARAELLAAVPVAGAVDRTSELLATPAAGGFGDGDRTSVLPPAPAGAWASGAPSGGLPYVAPATSVMAPLPEEPDAPVPARRRSRRTGLLVLGAAGLAGAGLLGVLAFTNSSNGGGGGAAQHPSSPAAASIPAPAAGGTGPANPSAPAGPTTSARAASGDPAAAIAGLRADMAATPMPKDRQTPLLKTLDAASAALDAGRPADAVQALHTEQRQVRDLSKKHTVDGQTAAAWQRQLTTVIGSLSAPGGDAADNGN
jgi:serine/threonine-protein kinase